MMSISGGMGIPSLRACITFLCLTSGRYMRDLGSMKHSSLLCMSPPNPRRRQRSQKGRSVCPNPPAPLVAPPPCPTAPDRGWGGAAYADLTGGAGTHTGAACCTWGANATPAALSLANITISSQPTRVLDTRAIGPAALLDSRTNSSSCRVLLSSIYLNAW